MLLLLFYLGDDMYSIKCERVREVAPMVRLKGMTHAPEFVSGLLNYRGQIVPVIDLKRLIHGVSCEMRLSTRIILVDFGERHTIGLVAERVTETIRRPPEALLPSGVETQDTPYLSKVIMEQDDMIQFIDLDLFPLSLNFIPMPESQ